MAEKNNNWIKSWAYLIIRFRWLVLLFFIIAAVLLGSGAKNLTFNNSYRVFFGADNPQLAKFDELQRVYTKTDNLIIAIKPEKGGVFNKNTLALVKELTEKAWLLPYSTRVDSITNYQHTSAEGDDLTVRDMLEGEAKDLSDQQIKYIKDTVLVEPTLKNRLIAEDALTTGVYVTFNLPDITEENKATHAFIVPQLATKIRALRDEMLQKYEGHKIALSGIVMMNNSFAEESQKDIKSLMVIMLSLIHI